MGMKNGATGFCGEYCQFGIYRRSIEELMLIPKGTGHLAVGVGQQLKHQDWRGWQNKTNRIMVHHKSLLTTSAFNGRPHDYKYPTHNSISRSPQTKRIIEHRPEIWIILEREPGKVLDQSNVE
jgi:hypothetical protein